MTVTCIDQDRKIPSADLTKHDGYILGVTLPEPTIAITEKQKLSAKPRQHLFSRNYIFDLLSLFTALKSELMVCFGDRRSALGYRLDPAIADLFSEAT